MAYITRTFLVYLISLEIAESKVFQPLSDAVEDRVLSVLLLCLPWRAGLSAKCSSSNAERWQLPQLQASCLHSCPKQEGRGGTRDLLLLHFSPSGSKIVLSSPQHTSSYISLVNTGSQALSPRPDPGKGNTLLQFI